MAAKTRKVTVTMTRHIKVEQKTCPQCGKKFEGAKVARFCSKSCANKASYQRHAEEARERRREKYQARKENSGEEVRRFLEMEQAKKHHYVSQAHAPEISVSMEQDGASGMFDKTTGRTFSPSISDTACKRMLSTRCTFVEVRFFWRTYIKISTI